MQPTGNDQQLIQGVAEHLARESGRTVSECWSDALSVLYVIYERRVLARDETGAVVDLGDIGDLYPEFAPAQAEKRPRARRR